MISCVGCTVAVEDGVLVCIPPPLLVPVPPHTVVPYVHHAHRALLLLAHGHTCRSLQPRTVAVYTGPEASITQVEHLECKLFMRSLFLTLL